MIPCSLGPFPPPGPHGVSSPASPVLRADLTPERPSRRASFPSLGGTTPATWVSCVPAWAPVTAGHARDRPRGFCAGCPHPVLDVETIRPPRFLRNPIVNMPCSLTPVGCAAQTLADRTVLPSTLPNASASTISCLSGLANTACSLAVYASQPGIAPLRPPGYEGYTARSHKSLI